MPEQAFKKVGKVPLQLRTPQREPKIAALLKRLAASAEVSGIPNKAADGMQIRRIRTSVS
jgi:hypothetical protein